MNLVLPWGFPGVDANKKLLAGIPFTFTRYLANSSCNSRKVAMGFLSKRFRSPPGGRPSQADFDGPNAPMIV